MLFETDEYCVDYINKEKDVEHLISIYNTNTEFLTNHTNFLEIDKMWITNEIEQMNKYNFKCCKIVSKKENRIVGLIDFSDDELYYLSLMIIHKDYKSKGIGKSIYNAFELYLKSLGCKNIRIDVLKNYNNKVLKFWKDRGFIEVKTIELDWSGKKLEALYMLKQI